MTSKAAYNSLDIWQLIVHSITKVITFSITGAVLIMCFSSLEVISDNWAGKVTIAKVNIGADVNANIDIDANTTTQQELSIPAYSWLPGILGLIFGVAGVSYGRAQSGIRKDVVEQMHGYQKKWEQSIDGNRSTSELDHRGNTKQGDI